MQMWSRNKRALSESDCEDLYHDDQSKDCSSSGEGLLNESHCGTSGNTGGGGNMTRKRRRGIIEKRRRDRINHSLSELRRLVPSAFEKQGSAKLEKAEILQLTVDHLKMLHAKGLDALSYDPHKYAMDYHNIGFRECAAEVARYMVSVEGMDVQDPLRLRLMSHLQCFAAQRELSNKPPVLANNNSSNISSATSPASTPAPPTNNITPSSGSAPAPPPSNSQSWPFPPPPSTYNNYTPNAAPTSSVQHHHHQHIAPASSMHYGMTDYGGMDGSNSYNPPPSSRLVQAVHHSSMPHHHPHPGHTMTTLQPVQHHHHHPAPSAPAPYPHVNHHPFPSLAAQNATYSTSGNQVKPYRPWGAELAY